MKARGWVSIVAGTVIIVVIGAVAAFIANLVATHAFAVDRETAIRFLGRVSLSFGAIALCGVIALGNGVGMLRTGRSSRVAVIAIAVLFAAALFNIYGATSAFQTSGG